MGPPFLFIEGGGSHQGKVGFTPLYPGVNPTPHWLPVPHRVELKFPRVINPDSPLNVSRQLEDARDASKNITEQQSFKEKFPKIMFLKKTCLINYIFVE